MNSGLKLGAAMAALLAATAIVGCARKDAAKSPEPEQSAEAPKPTFGAFGVDTSQGDPSVKPGDSFARYANGKWLDTFQIPADLSGFTGFTQLRLDAESDIREIVEELGAKQSQKGSLEQKVGDFFKSWMNESKIDAAGAAPLKPELDKIFALNTKDDFAKAFADLHLMGPVGFGILPDPQDTTRYTVFMGQNGIGLPDRDYYLKTDDRFVQYRAAYKDYIAKLLSLAGVDDAATKAGAILAFETKLAEVQWSQEDSRDIEKTYNPMSAADIAKLAPETNWTLILDDLGIAGVSTYIVAQPSAVDKQSEIFAKESPATLRDYLAFHYINNYAQFLSTDFDAANFDFFSKTLRGIEEKRARWKRGVNQIDASLGDAVGQIYVQRHFPPEYKAKMDALVANLTAALKQRLEQNEWMDQETRDAALLKLSTFEPRIGYATKWTDYSSLQIGDDLLENAKAITEFQWRDQVDRLKGPVDRQRWGYPPQTVNASYNPLLNQITFPAGILQPPFFDPNADAAVNYGGIGAVIGHEIGHGFDDQGSAFDEKGRIRNWWSPQSKAAFKAKTDALGKQYDAFEPIPGMHVNGQLTMGENIGDLGGLQMAYAAYHRYLEECCGGEAPVIDGFTGDQRFFLAWAQVWRGKYREDEARQRLLTDPHSPPSVRAEAPVRDIDAWYAAFDVREGDKLYIPPEERVKIW
jgi:endothelin-converting enzyme/putative endopeptidase